MLTQTFPNANIALTRFLSTIKSGQGIIATLKSGISGLWGVIKAHPIAAAITAITALTTLYKKYQQSLEKAAQLTEAQAEKSQSQYSALVSLKEQLSESDGTTAAVNELTEKFKEQLQAMGYTEDGINILIGKYRELSGAIDEATEEAAKKGLADAYVNMNAQYDAVSGLLGSKILNAINPSTVAIGWSDFSEKNFQFLVEYFNVLVEGVRNTEKVSSEAGAKIRSSFTKIFSDGEKDSAFKQVVDSYIDKVGDLKSALEKLRSGELDPKDSLTFFEKFPELASQTDNLDDAVVRLIQDMQTDMNNRVAEQISNMATEEDRKAVEAYGKELCEFGNISELTASKITDLSSTIDKLEKAKDIFETANEEMAETGEISNNTLKSIVELMNEGENYLDYLKIENGQLKLNTEAWEARAIAAVSADIATLDAERKKIEEENNELMNQLALLNSIKVAKGALTSGATMATLVDTSTVEDVKELAKKRRREMTMDIEYYRTYLDRACAFVDENKGKEMRQEILNILAKNQVSLAETKGIFIDVLDYIEQNLPIRL